MLVVPLAGTWIETIENCGRKSRNFVVPLAGTWIETKRRRIGSVRQTESFPSRERGLKLAFILGLLPSSDVVPLAGTWIETCDGRRMESVVDVVPLAGTWIETEVYEYLGIIIYVVPLAGTWIETVRQP